MINNYKRKVDLRENMYFRTTYGKIDKILDLNDGYVKGVSQKDNSYVYDIDNIVKASYNIIDILEVGDYVSTVTGECAVIAGVYNDINSKKYLRLCNCIGEYYEDDIKSIVTHEQMEQIAYKVGD